jgi:hypothetical protein
MSVDEFLFVDELFSLSASSITRGYGSRNMRSYDNSRQWNSESKHSLNWIAKKCGEENTVDA